MSSNDPKEPKRPRLRPQRPDFKLDQMFETRSEAWVRAGLSTPADLDDRARRQAQSRAAVMVLAWIAVVVIYRNYQTWFPVHSRINSAGDRVSTYWPHSGFVTPIRIAAVLALLAIGWAVAREIGRAMGPALFKRMDPSTAGTVGFVIRLITVGITLLVALDIAGASASSIVAGSAFTAVIIGLAAQQTLGNVFAGMVLLSARPFRVGERVRLQAGAVGGQLEGVVSSLGLLYTTLLSGAERVMVPNNVVLNAAVLPLTEPEPVDVRVRLETSMRPSRVQAILDDRVRTPTRRAVHVGLEAMDGNDVIVRVQATPEHANDGSRLADEIIDALASVTGSQPVVTTAAPAERADSR